MTKCRYPENNDCTLTTPVFMGTKSAINAWNNRKYMDQWIYLDDGEKAKEYMIMI